MTIFLVVFGYASCMVLTGFIYGLLDVDWRGDPGPTMGVLFAPIGLVFGLALLAAKAGERARYRRNALLEAKIAAAMAEVLALQEVDRELEKRK